MVTDGWRFVSTLLLMAVSWYPLMWLVGQVDGWGQLARHYRLTGPFPAERRRSGSGDVGEMQYTWTLDLAVRTEGLYLATHPLFRPGHPPLLIPWAAVRAAYRAKTPWSDRTRLLVRVGDDARAVPLTFASAVLAPVFPRLPIVEVRMISPVIAWRVLLLGLLLLPLGAIWFWFVWLRGMFG